MKTLKKLLFLIGFILIFSFTNCEKEPESICFDCYYTITINRTYDRPYPHTVTEVKTFPAEIYCDVPESSIRDLEEGCTYYSGSWEISPDGQKYLYEVYHKMSCTQQK